MSSGLKLFISILVLFSTEVYSLLTRNGVLCGQLRESTMSIKKKEKKEKKNVYRTLPKEERSVIAQSVLFSHEVHRFIKIYIWVIDHV